MEIVVHNLKQGIMITLFVFVMMMFIDYLNVLTKGSMNKAIRGNLFKQYVMASFLGATPGCLGAFMDVSFYIRGLLSFGAIAGGMIATSGDEAFVMLAMFPGKALLLFGILFVLGIISAFMIDKIVPVLRINPCEECQLSELHAQEECRCLHFKEVIEHLKEMSLSRFLLLVFLIGALYCFVTGVLGPEGWDWKRGTFVVLLSLANFIVLTVPDHYLEEHLWRHIAKEHLWRIFLWSFGALLVVEMGLKSWNLEPFIKAHLFWVLSIASFVAIIPESGPHLIFVMMFAKGLLPFSVLLASSIVQDGHGMLPLLSYTIKDSLLIKVFNFLIGLGIGFILYKVGL